MGGSLQLGPRLLLWQPWQKGEFLCSGYGFHSRERELHVHTDNSKAFDMQRGSRSCKKLLASSCGWREDAYESQISAAQVSDTGISKVALVRLPCCRTTAAGESSSVFLLRESLVGRPWGSEEPPVFQELRVSKLILFLHGCSKDSLKSYSKAIRTLWSVPPVQVWVPPGLLMWGRCTAWTESLSCILTWECVSRRLHLFRDPGWLLGTAAPDCSDLHKLIP